MFDLGKPHTRRAVEEVCTIVAPRYAITQGNSLELTSRLPSGSVDLIFADPPYFLSGAGTTSAKSGQRVEVDKGEWDEAQDLAAIYQFHRRWLAAARRLLADSGTIWVSTTQHSAYAIGFAMQSLGFHLLNTITWAKPNATPNLGCRTFTHSTELLLWAAPKKYSPLRHHFAYADMKEENGGVQMRDFWTIPTVPAREKTHGHHPTQKPLELLERVVQASSRPGDLVLDPFMGSGTTGVAAVKWDRRFVGMDLDAAYVELARSRMEAELVACAK